MQNLIGSLATRALLDLMGYCNLSNPESRIIGAQREQGRAADYMRTTINGLPCVIDPELPQNALMLHDGKGNLLAKAVVSDRGA